MDERAFWDILRERGDRYCALRQAPDSLVVQLVNAQNHGEILMEIPLNQIRSAKGVLRKAFKRLKSNPASDLRLTL